ncbi:hypothetical protein ALC53_04379 [Atta colombica]|uniref:Uncharacterized protein n=1 Tax=Atta colombica TaxID=520822 RepID=A0A195BLS1_9HYME|nr:hypothetical protein ALC53_04379 [Atta colombica]
MRKAKPVSILLIVSNNCDVYSLTVKKLEYIPKIILLREFKNYIDQLWDRLSEHINSEIQQHLCYFPAVDLSDGDYELSLMDFETYHTICNVNSSNNKFYFDEDNKEIVIPEGSYDINKYLKRAILQFNPNNCKRENAS